jgi:hypothetical protein
MKTLIYILSVILLTACSSYTGGLVIPKEDGTYEVQSTANTSDKSVLKALKTAGRTCQRKEGTHLVKDIKTVYEGYLDEKNSALGTIPVASQIALSAYRTTIIFVCK